MSTEGNWLKDDLKKAEARISELEKENELLKENVAYHMSERISDKKMMLEVVKKEQKVGGQLVGEMLKLKEGLEKVRQLFPTGDCSGKHLGKVRSWIQWTFRNGSYVTWGSDDQLGNSGLTVRQMEQLAYDIKDAVVSEILSTPVFKQ